MDSVWLGLVTEIFHSLLIRGEARLNLQSAFRGVAKGAVGFAVDVCAYTLCCYGKEERERMV